MVKNAVLERDYDINNNIFDSSNSDSLESYCLLTQNNSSN